MFEQVISMSRAARLLSGELGIEVSRREVSTLVRLFGVPTFDVPSNGNARGLDARGLERLRRIIREGSALACT
jgi:hypothetical protein